MRIAAFRCGAILRSLVLAVTVCVAAHGEARQPRIGIFTKEGASIDLSLQFVDSGGARASLRSMAIPNRPFILVPIFYRCPRLCGLTLSGVADLVNRLSLTLGKDYFLIAYSFNPDDTVADASERRLALIGRLSQAPTQDNAVQFLISDREAIATINEQLGFRVRYADKELEHSSAIFVVSPNGEVRRYFAGVEFDPEKVGASLRGN